MDKTTSFKIKVNKLFMYLCYSMILIWMFFPKLIFFQLIVILFIMALTIEGMQYKDTKGRKPGEKRK